MSKKRKIDIFLQFNEWLFEKLNEWLKEKKRESSMTELNDPKLFAKLSLFSTKENKILSADPCGFITMGQISHNIVLFLTCQLSFYTFLSFPHMCLDESLHLRLQV